MTSGTSRRSVRCPSATGPAAWPARASRAELRGNVVLVDRDQADRARLAELAEAFHDACLQHAQPMGVQDFGQDEFTRPGAARVVGGDAVLGLHPPVGRRQPAADARNRFIDADDPLRHARQLADGAAFVESVAAARQPRQHAIARRQGRRAAPLRRHQDLRRRRIVAPVERARHHLAVDVDAGDFHHRRLRQGRRSRQPAAAPALDRTLRGDLLQHRLQRDAVAAGNTEGARDLPLAHRRRALADELEDLLLRRQRRLLLPALAHHAQIRSILSGHNPRAALSAAS